MRRAALAPSAMKPGMSRTRQNQAAWPWWSAGSATRTRTGGSATRGLRTLSPATPRGTPSGVAAGEGSANIVTKRDFVAVIGEESGNECTGERQMVPLVDVTTETRATGVSTFTVPDSGGFCGRGGRFGPHSSNENMTPIYYNRVLFIAYFNAGVRALDIRDPYHPKEIGYFIPAATSKTSQQCLGRGANAPCKVQIQTNNVKVDERGYIYIADRANTGVHILELSGAARKVARFPS